MNKYISTLEKKSLKRQIHNLPPFVQKGLERNNLETRYKERPAYQKNDYIGWIGRAKRDETRSKRLNQMLNELKGGSIYMGMKWKDK